MKYLIPALLGIACSQGGNKDTEASPPETEDTALDCGDCEASLALRFDHETWLPGEYHFFLSILDIDETYECVSTVPAGVYMGPDNCPIYTIVPEVTVAEEGILPTALLLYRSDFSSLTFSVTYIDEEMSNIETLQEGEDVFPRWQEDDCGCVASDDVTLSF